MKRVIGATIGLLLSIPLLASARHLDVPDSNDTKGLLDVNRVYVGGRDGQPRWVVSTFSRWRIDEIWDSGFFLVQLDTFGNRNVDYYALVRSDGRRLSGDLYRDRVGAPDKRLAGVRVTHGDQDSLSVSVPLRKLRRRDDFVYSWYVQTLFRSRNCRRTCIDRIPDGGMVAEPGPPEPTPSIPTPSPTITP